MQITAIRNRFMRVPRQNWHFVEIETDNGIVGVGEASLEWRERAVAAAVDEDWRRSSSGEDPNLIEHHWQRIYAARLLARQRDPYVGNLRNQ